jgi:DNA-binding PadR family transcriptional regulator
VGIVWKYINISLGDISDRDLNKARHMSVREFLSDFSRFYILMILYEQPSHGYDILNRFRTRVGKEVSPSLVYPFLQKLEQKKLVKCHIRKIGEKEKKVFELTAEGRELCTRLFKRFSNLVSVAIEPSLEVCAHCGCKVYEGGYQEPIDGRETTFCCVHCAQAFKEDRHSVEVGRDAPDQ